MSRTRFLFAGLALVVLGGAPSAEALAKAVLVPSNETSSESGDGGWRSKLPNLGLGKIFSGNGDAQTQKDAASSSQKTETPTLLPEKAGSSAKTAPTLAETLNGAAGSGQASSGVSFPKNATAKERLAVLDKMRENYLKGVNHRPPTILPDTSFEVPEEMTKDFSGRVNLSVSEAYMWSPEDVSRITMTMGYDAKEIQKNCQLRIMAHLVGEGSHSMKGVMAGHKTVVPYQGALQSISLLTKAVCAKPPAGLPNNSQIVETYKGFYQAPLSFGSTCTIPQTRYEEIIIQYQGTGQPTCVFR